MAMVAEHLNVILSKAGYKCQLTTHSVWENYSCPPVGDLILQLLPAYSPSETACPLINIRPLLMDLDHRPTIEAILEQVRLDHQGASNGSH
jgi:hypothetical protein